MALPSSFSLSSSCSVSAPITARLHRLMPLILKKFSFLAWQITYGTVLKLMHERTKFRLHSHDVPYGSGSGQQSVTSFPNVEDSNSYWVFSLSSSLLYC
ncbi:Stromal cell-derived factor 2-like protein [Vitis vinifera]|uniref:Stromal cell-derived factor 2-like protein n=1 Tax=Vitis vinifera TaxID=29760 RepID=A0A438F2I7_VITVI|nr:Stromal cell-derived factor 2-like protein [Vitis vinifera]